MRECPKISFPSFSAIGREFYCGGVKDMSPTYFRKYVSRTSFDTRVDQVLAWIDLPATSRPSFISLYVNQPDNAAHSSGTKSQQINQAIRNVDQLVARLYAGLQRRNLVGCVNVIVLSDHGMSDIDCKNVVDIQNYMNVSEVYATMGPYGRLRPRGRRIPASVANVVSKLRCKSDHMRVYPKEQLPVRFHFADNDRIEPIFLDMDSGWTVVSKGVKGGDDICTGGAHGYDNLFPDMRAIFIANGPSIKSNITIRPFINTELYELMSEMINIIPNPNNGTRGSLHHILKSPHSLPQQYQPNPPAVGYVPKEDPEYNYRVNAANCSCPQAKKQVTIDDSEIIQKNGKHLPFGVPFSSVDNSTLRVLYNEDYILAFDLKFRIPMWTSFTLDGKRNSAGLEEENCWTGDARIPISDAANCRDYSSSIVKRQHLLQRPLYPPGFSDSTIKEQAAFITNSIPKSRNHTNILENKLHQILSKWAAEENQLNVVMGSAFDLLATGVRPDVGKIIKTREIHGPLIVPTHIFVVVTWCSAKVNKIKDCNSTKLETQAFLLPNKPFNNNCEPGEKVIQNNVARVVDVEKLTGLSFYTGLPIYDTIRLRTSMPLRSAS